MTLKDRIHDEIAWNENEALRYSLMSVRRKIHLRVSKRLRDIFFETPAIDTPKPPESAEPWNDGRWECKCGAFGNARWSICHIGDCIMGGTPYFVTRPATKEDKDA